MTVALLSIELHLATAQSLKDKRHVLRRLKDRLAAFNVATAEVAHQDLWQRAGLGVVTVASSDLVAEQTLTKALDEIERLEPGLVTESRVEYFADMSQGSRPARVGEELRQALGELLAREVHDPGLGFVTITGVDVSHDLMHARVSYTSLGDDQARRDTARALTRATPFLRRAIGHRLRLRRVPDLEFHFDRGVENQAKIERILIDLADERASRGGAPEGSADAQPSEEAVTAPVKTSS